MPLYSQYHPPLPLPCSEQFVAQIPAQIPGQISYLVVRLSVGLATVNTGFVGASWLTKVQATQ